MHRQHRLSLCAGIPAVALLAGCSPGEIIDEASRQAAAALRDQLAALSACQHDSERRLTDLETAVDQLDRESTSLARIAWIASGILAALILIRVGIAPVARAALCCGLRRRFHSER